MTTEVSARGWLVPVVALIVAAFAVCTTELSFSGLLPAIATDLGVDIPTAGLLITGYALGVAFIGPLLSLVTGGVPRKVLLLVIMAVFAAGNVVSALSGTYAMLLGARIVIAACHGLFFGIAMVMATRLAPEGRQTTAVSLVTTGVNVAIIVGIPLGTAIGTASSWRTTLWVITGLVALAALVLALLIPDRDANPTKQRSDLRAEFAAATRPMVLLCYGAIALQLVAFFAMIAYMVPFLTGVVGVPLEAVPLVLLATGAATFLGNLVGGRLGDWNPSATMVASLALNVLLFLVLWRAPANAVVVTVLLGTIWLIGFTFTAPVQTRILRETRDAPNLASTFISTAFQLGIAAGAALGGAAIAAGMGYENLPLLSAVFIGLALASTLLLVALDRWRRPAVA